jgi:hypothetical protein
LSLVKAAEREQLQAVIEKSFARPGWAALHTIDARSKTIATRVRFKSANWLALQHGARIVGVLLMTDPDAPAQRFQARVS